MDSVSGVGVLDKTVAVLRAVADYSAATDLGEFCNRKELGFTHGNLLAEPLPDELEIAGPIVHFFFVPG